MNKGQLLGMALLLLGVACLSALVFQLNSYITYTSVAGMMKTESQKALSELQGDPALLSAYGITASDLEQYGPQLTSYIEKNAQSVYLQANALVLPMALDLVLGVALCYFGIRKAAQHS
jgi:hypothetical protein